MIFWQICVSDGRSETHIVLLGEGEGHGSANWRRSARKRSVPVAFIFSSFFQLHNYVKDKFDFVLVSGQRGRG